ncbi:hypothetical protein WAH84_20565, partial [Acinetobacter baumannii]
QSFKFFIRHRHQHIKPSAKEIAKVHILKADISILELHFLFRIRDFMLKNKLLKYKYVVELN